MPPPIAPAAWLRASLDALADAVEGAGFDLPAEEQHQRRDRRDRIVGVIRRFLVPRLGDPEAPLLVAVFGPTGSGKSTLVNSLAGSEVSTAGTLRPTTREAVVWCHRRHADRYPAHPLADTGPMRLVPDDHPLLAGLTLVDTPDVDSVVAEHRLQTEGVLAVCDAAVYVTTAQRYADAVPWELLSDLTRRDLPLMVVANRLSRRSGGVVADLASLLREEGVTAGTRTADILTIQEHRMRERLPGAVVRRISSRLSDLGADHEEVVRRAVSGSLRVVIDDAGRVVGDLAEQRRQGELLARAAADAYRSQQEEIARQLDSGDLVRGEVVARWQRLVGVSDLARIVGGGMARLRAMVAGGGASAHAARTVEAEARTELVELVTMRARQAARTAAGAWELDPAGSRLLSDDLRRVDPGTVEAAGVAVDDWMAGLVQLVTETGGSRFRLARAASVGVNVASVVLLLGVFASTGGLTGMEAGIAAGAAAANQSVLEHLFGRATAHRLADRARAELVDALARVLAADADRWRRRVEDVLDPASAPAITAAVESVQLEAEAVGRG